MATPWPGWVSELLAAYQDANGRAQDARRAVHAQVALAHYCTDAQAREHTEDARDRKYIQDAQGAQDAQDGERAQSARWAARGRARRTAQGPGRRRVRARARSECRAA